MAEQDGQSRPFDYAGAYADAYAAFGTTPDDPAEPPAGSEDDGDMAALLANLHQAAAPDTDPVAENGDEDGASPAHPAPDDTAPDEIAPDDTAADETASGETGDGDQPGAPGQSALAGEAARLLVLAQDWVRTTFPGPVEGHGGPQCQWCPLCQFVAVLRGERPELTERVAEAGASLAQAARAFVEAALPPAPGNSAAPPPAGEQARRPRPGVQHIDLGFDPT